MEKALSYTEDAPKNNPWVRVGVGFTTKSGNGFNIEIGNKAPKERGSKEYVETVKSLNLEPGDQLYLGIATDREGKTVTTKNGATVYRLMLKPRQEENKQ